jgi:hypothetical protein
MPGFVLTQSAQVMCMHGGQATPTVPSPRVSIAGSPAITQPPPWIVGGCSFTAPPGPCVSAQWVSASTRVTAGGQPLLLQDSMAVCAAPGTGVLVTMTQIRVRAQ